MKDLLERIKIDIINNPEKLEQYLSILINNKMITPGTNIKMTKISDRFLEKCQDNQMNVSLTGRG